MKNIAQESTKCPTGKVGDIQSYLLSNNNTSNITIINA